MEDIITGLNHAIETENWYTSLFVAFAIPDICSKIQYPDKYTNVRYPDWFQTHRNNSYRSHLSGKDCYALRCAILHEGSQSIEGQRAQEIIHKFSFSGKGSHLISFSGIHLGSSDDGKNVCHLSVKKFSQDMVESYRSWLQSVQSDSGITQKLDKTLDISVSNSLYDGNVQITN